MGKPLTSLRIPSTRSPSFQPRLRRTALEHPISSSTCLSSAKDSHSISLGLRSFLAPTQAEIGLAFSQKKGTGRGEDDCASDPRILLALQFWMKDEVCDS